MSNGKPIRIPPHTAKNFHERDIASKEVEQTVGQPEKVVAGYDGRQIYMRRYIDSILNQEMLLRVVVEETEQARVVVTVYKTSKIQKYLKEETK
jgi:hypothetical protein